MICIGCLSILLDKRPDAIRPLPVLLFSYCHNTLLLVVQKRIACVCVCAALIRCRYYHDGLQSFNRTEQILLWHALKMVNIQDWLTHACTLAHHPSIQHSHCSRIFIDHAICMAHINENTSKAAAAAAVTSQAHHLLVVCLDLISAPIINVVYMYRMRIVI